MGPRLKEEDRKGPLTRSCIRTTGRRSRILLRSGFAQCRCQLRGPLAAADLWRSENGNVEADTV